MQASALFFLLIFCLVSVGKQNKDRMNRIEISMVVQETTLNKH